MRIYTFRKGESEGSGDMIGELGRKGAGLVDMSRLGVPVPPGFTISTDACGAYFRDGERIADLLRPEIERGMRHIEKVSGRRFGASEKPLLVSVRSGASVSMPGMMDTILNVGLTRKNLDGLVPENGQKRFAVDSYRRFVELYAEVALNLDRFPLRAVRDEVVSLAGVEDIHALPESWLEGLIAAYERTIEEQDKTIPSEPQEQLLQAIMGVFRSWNTRRAVRYRRSHGIPDDLGTAVTVQAMVFGNLDQRSGTGVAFTRDPNTGEPGLFGEYLPQAQGEDVVNGSFTPNPLTGAENSLEVMHPDAFSELGSVAETLESHLGDMQDLEFTVEDGTLWMLQTRTAKRSARAAVRISVDMASEGVIDKREALRRIKPEQINRLLHPSVDMHAPRRVIAKGLPASPGAVSGQVVFDPEQAVSRGRNGERIILVRLETSAEDMEAIGAATGVLTSRGGMTSHAALVARGLGKPCVTGCATLLVDESEELFKVRGGNHAVRAGSWITIDGATGEVILGEVATLPAEPPRAFSVLMGWADEVRTLAIKGNADNARDAKMALEHGANGIGLCRTEHMFLQEDHLGLVREMVLAYDTRTRRNVVEHILPVQRADFFELLSATGRNPVAIRLLDLPLHDLMPGDNQDLEEVAERLESTVSQVASRARMLEASNPVLGHRGARLGLTFPELYEVQIRALVEAMIDGGGEADVRLVLPLVTCAEEVKRLKRRILSMATKVCEERSSAEVSFQIGAMVESPRACLTADEIAKEADFILFGTTDLTISTFAIHRDDAGRYLPFYVENGVLPADPFVRLDLQAVGELIKIGLAGARRVDSRYVCGLAGGHTADERTISWCSEVGIDYITCAPHRVPFARVAAAKAAL